MDSIACDVVLLPEERIASKAIEVSKEFKKLGTLLTLGKDVCVPHMSVYMLQVKVADLNKVGELLQDIIKNFREFNLKPSRYFEVKQFIDVEYQKTSELEKLQKEVIGALNPIRDGLREDDKARAKEAIGMAKENFQKYGSKEVFELYRPHLTFTRFTQEQENAISLLPKISTFNGSFSELGLFELGENGTCVRKIAAISLN